MNTRKLLILIILTILSFSCENYYKRKAIKEFLCDGGSKTWTQIKETVNDSVIRHRIPVEMIFYSNYKMSVGGNILNDWKLSSDGKRIQYEINTWGSNIEQTIEILQLNDSVFVFSSVNYLDKLNINEFRHEK